MRLAPMSARPPLLRSPFFYAWLLILSFGVWLRLPTAAHSSRKGFDEAYYEKYVTSLGKIGLGGWPTLIESYIAEQKEQRLAFLPPTRVLFLGSAHVWSQITGTAPIEAVRAVSCGAGIALLLLGAAMAWRFSGPAAALGVGALLGCAPLLIHLSHRALIDGFFAFWATVALWGFFESLRTPERRGWLAVYGAGLAAMVMTKENAAFAYAALFALMVLNRWLRIGTVTREFVAVTLLAPAGGALMLVLAAGGIDTLLGAYRINIEKSVELPYALSTGDGQWHRYLLDFLLVSPAVTLLAVASLGGTGWSEPAKRCLALFVFISYAVMAQVRYGMNLRYGAMWEVPLCWLAFTLLATLAIRWAGRWQIPALTAAVVLVCTVELTQYHRLFVKGNVYDPVAGSLMPPLQMWKPANGPKP